MIFKKGLSKENGYIFLLPVFTLTSVYSMILLRINFHNLISSTTDDRIISSQNKEANKSKREF